jgi:hypothetical protein
MRFVSKKLFEKDTRRARRVVVGAATEGMVDGTAEHTTWKSNRILALEIGDRVDGEHSRRSSRRWLISLHCLLGGGHECTNRSVVRGATKGGRARSSGRGKGDGKRSSECSSRGLLEFAEHSFSDQAFLVAEDGMISDSGDTKGPKGSKLG